MKPEKDVPELMRELVTWIASALGADVPIPVIAGLAHYQFVTIHPYYDGNGRTARLLATFLLHQHGYGLNGFLSVEEFYARDLAGYYAALAVNPHHNYYMGRAVADLSDWIEYFTATLAQTFEAVAVEARRLVGAGLKPEPACMRHLDRRREPSWLSSHGKILSPQVMSPKHWGFQTAWPGCCSNHRPRTAGWKWLTPPARHVPTIYRHNIGNTWTIYRQ
ncbi:MAG: Fic family protein [Victivallales bacterium]|nr:Fic family protein [Victivallales bacterium]